MEAPNFSPTIPTLPITSQSKASVSSVVSKALPKMMKLIVRLIVRLIYQQSFQLEQPLSNQLDRDLLLFSQQSQPLLMTTMTRLIVKLKFLLSIQLCQPLEYLLPMVCQQLKHSPRNYLQPLINILKRKLFLSHILVVVRHLPLISHNLVKSVMKLLR